MLCVNAICLVSLSYMWIMQCHLVYPGIIYVNFAMPPWLASHLICELYHAIIFLLRVKFVNNFSTFNYSSCASAIWIGDGEIWSENKVFRAGNGTCWSIYLDGYRELLRGGFRDRWPVLFPPPKVYALTWQGYVAHIVRMVSCIAMSFD